MSTIIQVHDPNFLSERIPRKKNSPLRDVGYINKNLYVFLSLLVLAVGAILVGFRVGGINGMIGASASAIVAVILIACIYCKAATEREKKIADCEVFLRDQDYTAEELAEYLANCDREEIEKILDTFTLEGMVEFINYLSQNSHVASIYGEIVQATPREDISGELVDPEQEHQTERTTWDTIKEAVIKKYPENFSFLEIIRANAKLAPIEESNGS